MKIASTVLAAAVYGLAGGLMGAEPSADDPPLSILVTDPLAKELCCACVAGTGQRDYEALGRYLAKALKRKVEVHFAPEPNTQALLSIRRGPDLIVGKEGPIPPALEQWRWPMIPIARLTDLQGRTTLTGLLVVPAADPARDLSELSGRPLWLGPMAEREKHGAALAALWAAGATPGPVVKVLPSCTTTATELLAAEEKPAPVGVVSSYALPLLEGCGNIPPRSLRVVGRTAPVPFITVFMYRDLEAPLPERLQAALWEVGRDRALCRKLESRDGFVPYEDPQERLQDWPQWGGALGQGRTASLPAALPQPLPLRWERRLNHPGLGGVAAAGDYVVVSDRDPLDKADVWRCLRAANGEPVWTIGHPTRGPRLDYGNSPRATPLLAQGRAFLLGAYGDLLAVELATGKLLWKKNLVKDFKGIMPQWGYSTSPLWFEQRVWVAAGGTKNFVAGLDPATGRVLCAGAGSGAPGYAALVAGEWGGVSQVAAYQENCLAAWDSRTGRQLWKVTPPEPGDFNVPTPARLGDGLLLATENNGARLHRFDGLGRLRPEPAAASELLQPVTASPVAVGFRALGCGGGALHCLEWRPGQPALAAVWKLEEDAWAQHASFLTDGERVLALGFHGDLLLLDATAPQIQVLVRQKLWETEEEIYAHPALARGQLYVRGARSLRCYDLQR